MTARCLDDVRVLELGQVYNAPYCGLLLAAQGADVIKVEPPGGEIIRRHAVSPGGASYSFLMLNADKRGVTLDLKKPAGRDLFLRLVEKADVVLENFSDGVLARLDLEYDVLAARNPRVVLASGRGYRPGSPYADFAAMDFTIQAISGHMAITGFPESPPVKAGATFCDMLGATHLFAAVLLALRERERTGRGRVVEIAMLDATFPSLMSYASPYLETGNDPGRVGNRHAVPGSAPYGSFPTKDGWVAIMCVTDEHWARFCEVCPDPLLAGDESLRRMQNRGPRRDWIEERVAAWTRDLPRAELLDRLVPRGIPCAPVRELGEALDDPYNVEQGLLRHVSVEGRGDVRVLGSPIRLEDEVAPPRRPPPALGEHNREVYGGLLGLAHDEIEELARKGVL